MGNRAVITTEKGDRDSKLGVYLHWNGGRDSVQAFLKYCQLKGFRPPEQDCYGWARLTQVIANFFGGGSLIGIDICSRLDCNNYDNGVYLIENWQIVGREDFDWEEQNEYDLTEMLYQIDALQPTREQLGKEKIDELLAKDESRREDETTDR